MTPPLEPYQARLNWLGSHKIYDAKQIVVDVFKDLGPSAGWQFLGENWDWFEATFHLADIVAVAARDGRVNPAARRLFMTGKERDLFRSLPIRLTVHRGGCGGEVERGLSWTLKSSVAEWFAAHSVGGRRAMFGFAKGQPRVVSGIVRRSQLLGIKVSRGEAEVIALPGAVTMVQ